MTIQVYRSFKKIFPLFLAISVSLTLLLFGVLAVLPFSPFTVRNTSLAAGFFISSVLGVGFLTGFYLAFGILMFFEWAFGIPKDIQSLVIA
jgi:hypothetical protein